MTNFTDSILTMILSLLAKYWWVLVLVLAVYIAAELFRKEKRRQYMYQRKDCVMTETERTFYMLLVSVVGPQYYIFPQIHLDALLEHKIRGQGWRGAFRHIDEKSVDFVLCDKASLRTMLAIELDEASHDRPDRIARDAEVERILEEASLPLLRVRGKDSHDRESVARLIRDQLTRPATLSGAAQ